MKAILNFSRTIGKHFIRKGTELDVINEEKHYLQVMYKSHIFTIHKEKLTIL